jgi:hypothetical protein
VDISAICRARAIGSAAIRGLHGGGRVFPGGTSRAPITLNLNVDGRKLAQAVSASSANSFDGQAPAFDGLSSFQNGDSQHTDH